MRGRKTNCRHSRGTRINPRSGGHARSPRGESPKFLTALAARLEAVPFPNYSADSTTEAVPFPKHWVGVPSVAPSLGNWIWRVGVALIAVSFVIQLASLAFWLPLEIYQMETLGHPTFVIALRFKNIVAFGLGKMDAWGLKNDSMTEDAWDYVHISTWNFLPFLLRRVGTAPRWVVDLAFTVWGTGIAALSLLVARFWHVVEW